MRTYENKDELKNEINKSFAKYISEFNDIPEHLKDKRIDEVDRTPAENLAYQVGWTTLVIKWESDERKGIPVKTPSDNFKWNQLGELYQWFTDTYAQLSLQELKDRLNENINSKLATTSSTGGLSLALQRAIVTARPKGRYRKHFYWPAIKRYYWNLLFSIPLLAHLYISELLHLLYCRLFQHNIL